MANPQFPTAGLKFSIPAGVGELGLEGVSVATFDDKTGVYTSSQPMWKPSPTNPRGMWSAITMPCHLIISATITYTRNIGAAELVVRGKGTWAADFDPANDNNNAPVSARADQVFMLDAEVSALLKCCLLLPE